MNTAVGVSMMASANANAAAANARAEEAIRIACASSMPSYRHEGATVESMQAYAQCVRRVHPEQMNADAVLSMKVLIILLMIGTVIGALIGMRDKSDTPVMMGFMGGMIGFCAAALLFLVFVGILFLANA